MTEQEFLDRFDNKKEFTNEELEEIIWFGPEEFNVVDTIYGENDRWSRPVTTIIKIEIDSVIRYFAIYWNEGLTELQVNTFNCRPEEVKPVEKQIVVCEWVGINE